MLKKKMFFGGTLNSLNENLVAYYSFDNNNAVDVINGYNGTLVGTPTFNAGINGNSIDFENDSVVRNVSIADNNDFSFTNGVPYSFNFWALHLGYSTIGNYYIGKRSSTSLNNEYQLRYLTSLASIDYLKFSQGNNAISQRLIAPTGIINLSQWQMITITDKNDGTNTGLKLYVNGVLISCTYTNNGFVEMTNGNNILRFGQQSFGSETSTKHRGKLDEVAIWKGKELTQLEVSELYNGGAGKFYPF